MFRLLKLKPPNGWSAVAWELAIVTLGVLIALGAQQIGDDFHGKREAGKIRAALRAEVSLDLGTYVYRNGFGGCIRNRLNELELWLTGWRQGRPVALIGPIGIPTSLVPNTNVWESRGAAIAHMPLREQLEYAHLYNEFANNDVHRLGERAAWLELADYDGATALEHRDLMRLQGLITRARLRDQRMMNNAERFIRRAAGIGLHPRSAPDWPAVDRQICRPILPTTSGARA